MRARRYLGCYHWTDIVDFIVRPVSYLAAELKFVQGNEATFVSCTKFSTPCMLYTLYCNKCLVSKSSPNVSRGQPDYIETNFVSRTQFFSRKNRVSRSQREFFFENIASQRRQNTINKKSPKSNFWELVWISGNRKITKKL